MKECIKCRQQLADDAVFCHACGEQQIQDKNNTKQVSTKTIIVIAVIAIGIIFAAIATILLKKEAIAQKKISLSVLINEIKSIKELNVIENDYKILVKADEKEKDCHVFCSEKSYIAVCDYTMKIKFDLEQVSVDINGQDIVVTYPHPEISSNERREDTPCRIFKDEDTTQEFRSNAMNSAVQKYKEKYRKEFEEEANDRFKTIVKEHLSSLLQKLLNAELRDMPSREYHQKGIFANDNIYVIKFIQKEDEKNLNYKEN